MPTLASTSCIPLSWLDYGTLLAILGAVLVCSAWAVAYNTSANLREYALGRSKLTALPLAFAILGVSCGGEQLSIIDTIARDGIIMAVIYAFWSLEFLFGALYLAPRIASFTGCLTKGDILTQCYGKKAGMFAGLVWALTGPLGTSVQYLAIGKIVAATLGTPPFATTLFLGILITLYATLSGGRAMNLLGALQFASIVAVIVLVANAIVVQELGELSFFGIKAAGVITFYTLLYGNRSTYLTGALQFISLATLIAIAYDVFLAHGYGLISLWSKVPAAKLSLWGHPKFWYYIVLLVVWEVFPQNICSVPVVQQLLMTEEQSRIQKSMFGLAVFCVGFAVVLGFLGLIGHVVIPGHPTQGIFYSLIAQYLPHGLQGFAVAGIMMLIVSGRDFSLHALSLGIVRSLLKPLAQSRGILLQEMGMIKATMLILGISATVIALRLTDAIHTMSYVVGVAVPLTTVPFLGAILLKKVRVVSYRNSAIATIAAFILSKALIPGETAYVIPLITLVSSILGYTVTHIFTKPQA